MKRPSKAKKTKKKPSKIQSLIDETIAESKSLEQEITKAIAKRKQSKSVVELDKKVASLSKADQKKYAREVEKTIKKKKKRIRSGSGWNPSQVPKLVPDDNKSGAVIASAAVALMVGGIFTGIIQNYL